MSFIQKVELVCDADHRSKVINRKYEGLGNVSNHDLQLYHIAIRLPLVEINEIVKEVES